MPGRASSPVRKVFEAPYRGINNALPPHQLGPNDLWAAFNCVFTGGSVITRRSMVQLATVTGASSPSFDTRPLGCWSATSSAGNFDIFVSTHTNMYRLRNLTGSWTDISGAVTLTNNNTDTPRFASIYNQATSQVATVMVNNTDDNVLSLDGGNLTFISIGSRKGLDITTAASRLVAIELPYYVWWSDIYSYQFPALNFYTALDTPGKVVAIRNLGALGIAVYKEDCIVVGYSQPGSPANAFRFEVRRYVPGPAGPSAVVEAEGRHFIMTSRGRIGMFDGSQFDWIGDGIWPYMLGDFDFDDRHQTHGFYDETHGQVWFVYPRVSDAGNGPTGLAIVTLPRPMWGVPSYGVWAGALALPASCSNTLKLTTGYAGLVMRSDSGNEDAEVIADAVSYSSFGDDETDFNCFLQTGLQPTGEIISVEIEPLLQRGADHGVCTLSPVTSYTLDNSGGTVGTAQTIDLEATSPVIRDVRGFGASGRFVGLRIDWQSRVPEAEAGAEEGGHVVYKGGVVTGYTQDS